ncbi:Holliday junction branch migration protein RuvA [Alkaliphilus pronyensis]|uniref:Holliday junction branch migration complex subunit RuvA n=1 Tax=Alkaliphilus pronyensis TaxID=1482732 RepID=A0A6I0F5V5_9FIRM|nr:Holliday junction branch migration protein RuvA [Alkaliphilus pronyensis]KAB3537265.1 Holliday junction branch migration protein RuvA [Alkaliphilus pronyensis]
MFEYIKGKISEVFIDKIVIEANGIGYRINSSMNSVTDVNIGEDTTIFTHLVVKEDEMSLYGFTTRMELDVFRKLISVSKVGPKVASGILSTYTADKLSGYIKSNNVSAISKSPGVGKKTAERIILELKDKVEVSETLESINDKKQGASENNEAIEALIALGYSGYEANKAYKAAFQEGLSTEDMIRRTLILLGK